MRATDTLLWWEEGLPTRPWLRGYVSPPFMDMERRRVEAAMAWFKRYNLKGGERGMPPVDLYAVPVDLDAGWKVMAAEEGRYAMGLSVLFDTDGLNVVGLFHNRPPQPALLRINDSRVVARTQRKTGSAEYFLLVEDYDVLPAEAPYLDLPTKSPEIVKHFRDTLHLDDHVQDALMRPLLGAPSVAMTPSGMTISSMAGELQDRMVGTFLTAMERMVPPEARKTPPPRPLVQGAWREGVHGIRFRYNSLPPRTQDEVFGLRVSAMEKLEEALGRRSRARGESSLWGTMTTRGVPSRAQFKAQLLGFTKTDAVVPTKLSSLFRSDVDFEHFWRSTSDDHWFAFIHAHTLHPSLDDVGPQYGPVLGRLREFIGEALEMTPLHGDALQGLADHLFEGAPAVLARNILSEARGRGSGSAGPRDVNAAVRSMQRSFNQFLEQDEVQAAAITIPARRANPRVEAVETVLNGNPGLTAVAIWEGIDRRNFTDLIDLQQLLDWCQKNGKVVADGQGRYTWIN